MKLFVWDLHGVLEKGNENAVLAVTNGVLEREGYSRLMTPAECDLLYGKKWYEYFEHLFPEESHERHLHLQELCFGYDRNVEIISKNVVPNDHSHDVLAYIARAHDQMLLSNTNAEGLDIFVDVLGLRKFFSDDRIFPVNSHKVSANSKYGVLEDFLRDKEYENIIIIGDSPSDIALAQVEPVLSTTYLYSHPGRPFKECVADYKIRDLRDVLREV